MATRGASGAQTQNRAHPRVPARIEAKLKLPDGRTQVAGRILNISLGGVFVEMAEPLGFGAELDLELALPDGVLRCKGLVVWSTRTAPQRAGGRSGVGLRLMKIGVADMRRLEAYVAERLEGSSL